MCFDSYKSPCFIRDLYLCWGFVKCYLVIVPGSAHEIQIISLWWLGTIPSGACIRSPAALLSTARRPREGCLWWSCTAHCGPLLLPRYHEAGGYGVVHSHSHNTTTASKRMFSSNYQLPSKILFSYKQHQTFAACIGSSIRLWLLYFCYSHMAYSSSPGSVTFSHQGIELHPDLTCSLPVWSDICLKEVPSIADSLYNIQLLREFATEHLNKSCYLTTEDMLYSPLVLKVHHVTQMWSTNRSSYFKWKF